METQTNGMGLTKNDFKKYSHVHRQTRNSRADVSSTNTHIRNHRDHNYINPYCDFRNFKLHKDFLYILFSSSNFLHSGSFYTHLEPNDFNNYTSPINSNERFIYFV